MALQVPITVLHIDSNGTCGASFRFTSAIAKMCFNEMVAAVSWPGRWLPESMPAAFLIKYEAGGVFITCAARSFMTAKLGDASSAVRSAPMPRDIPG
jgi:hypothetical protein